MKIPIYFATHFFYVPDDHKRDIEHLKNEFKKYPWFEVDTIVIPIRGDFTQVAWCYPKSDVFLERGHTLIVDTTHAPGVHRDLQGILNQHDIFLITCKQTSNPQSYDVLNADAKILQKMVSLEYRTIMDIRDHIFNHIAFHDCALQVKK